MQSDNIEYDLYLHVEKQEWWLWTDDGSGSTFHKGADISELQHKIPDSIFNRIMWEFIDKATEGLHVKKKSAVRLQWTQSEADNTHYEFL